MTGMPTRDFLCFMCFVNLAGNGVKLNDDFSFMVYMISSIDPDSGPWPKRAQYATSFCKSNWFFCLPSTIKKRLLEQGSSIAVSLNILERSSTLVIMLLGVGFLNLLAWLTS
ncbi:hypothetical protein BJX99DRAFT_225755 [Aspergillus californicus]